MVGDDVPRAWLRHPDIQEGGWVATFADGGTSMAIGQVIRLVRERKALSQDELALRLRDVAANDGEHPQTTRRTISRWERDSRIPQPAYRRWLAVALDLPVETLNRAAAVSQGCVPTDARHLAHADHDDSSGVLLVESDEAVLSYKAGIYNVRMRKRLVNRGSSPVCRFFTRIAVDRSPTTRFDPMSTTGATRSPWTSWRSRRGATASRWHWRSSTTATRRRSCGCSSTMSARSSRSIHVDHG
jgi:transcriptional regulator with XRE-family HTH domain